jgi:anti-sigma regulatory factor (Ser/Thr protein kinase)
VSPSDLRLLLPAKAENVLVVRQAVAGLGEAIGLPEQRIDDLKTVVTEACNNVVIHAYDETPGPLEVTAEAEDGEVAVVVADRGQGFEPRPSPAGEASLGLGLPLIAALSDSFEISGGAGEGTRTTIRFGYAAPVGSHNGTAGSEGVEEALSVQLAPGAAVRPILARVLGAMASRADLSVDRLADSVLLGDAVSSHAPADFTEGQVAVSIKEGEGALDVRVGPLIEGGGERILAQMEIPGGGSLRKLARSMEVTKGVASDGSSAEFLVFEIAT